VKRAQTARWIGYPAALLLVFVTIGLLKLVPGLTYSSAALFLILAVFFCAWAWESGPGVLAAIVAGLGFNFFFLPPFYTFVIEDPRNVVTFFVFLVCGLLIGRLSATARVRLRQVEAERRDLAALTDLSQGFLADTSRESLLGLAADRLRRALQSEQVSIWLAQSPGDLSELAATPGALVQRNLVDLAYRQGNSAAYPSELGGTDIYLPIPIGVTRAGVLVARGLQSTERMAEGCAVLLGLALERERFLQIAREAEKTKTSEQMKSTLLAALAHDLTTPVATARAAVENWQARAGPSDESRLARTELESLSRHVSDLMEVVRLDSGITRPRRERVGCGQIVEAALARFGDALSKHALYVDVPPEEIAVEVDPSQLTEALGHVLENAARYSPDNSEVRVSVSKDHDEAFIRVFDQGGGIPASDRERVFDRFVRLPSTAAVPGTGLGLSISRSLVEMNGGALRIGASEQGGAVFEIVLPKSP